MDGSVFFFFLLAVLFSNSLFPLKSAITAPKLLEQSAKQKNSAVKFFSSENNKHKNIIEVLKPSQVSSWIHARIF